jgi:phosphonoacetate hydrolase
VILVWVFDGLRPDLVTPELMPSLSALRERGAWFSQSYCAFPPVTRVNAATLGSGSAPGRHGIPGNTLFLRDSTGSSDGRFATTGDDAVLRGLRRSPATPLLNVPTLAEALAEHGLNTLVVGTGSPGCAYLLHPEVARAGGAIWHPSFAEPAALGRVVEEKLGPPPEAGHSTGALVARVDHAARALTEVLVPQLQPALSFFWCTVPDGLHHRFGLGSPEALAGLRQADTIFGRTIKALESETGAALDLIVTADHGYATVDRHVDVAGALEAALTQSGYGGRWAVSVDGGAAHLFARGGAPPDAALREATVAALLAHDWAGAVFAREETAGALPLAALGIDCDRSPDLLLTFAWSDAPNRYGYRGLSPGGGGIAIGAGDHGGGSPHELRNTLLAAGPSFRGGVYTGAAGIADLAPTVCCILNVPVPAQWSGRGLNEALARPAAAADAGPPDERSHLLTTAETRRQVWLSLVERGGRAYVRAAGRGEREGVRYDW